jgi:hypothetical protein
MILRRRLHHTLGFCFSWPGTLALFALWGLIVFWYLT